MKNILSLFLAMLISTLSNAQAPQKIIHRAALWGCEASLIGRDGATLESGIFSVIDWSDGLDFVKKETTKTKKQNFIYLTGSLPMISGYYIATFERELLIGNAGTLNLAVGYGGWSNWDGGGSVGLLSSHFISGKGKHHFESDIGLLFHNDKVKHVKAAPVKLNINAGYRIQQRDKPLVFRIGAGLPMGLYVSLGITIM